jgi:hypothetical protein
MDGGLRYSNALVSDEVWRSVEFQHDLFPHMIHLVLALIWAISQGKGVGILVSKGVLT